MIVQTEGCIIKNNAVAVGSATMIVSTSGIAYRKTTKVKSIIRFIKKFVFFLKQKTELRFKNVNINYKKNYTKTGKPSSLEPPVVYKT